MNCRQDNNKQILQTEFNTIIDHLHQKGSLKLVILFGSRATKTATNRSDIDIFAVYDNSGPNMTIISPPTGLSVGADILAFSGTALLKGLKEGKGLFIEVMTHGRILFGNPEIVQKYQNLANQSIKKLKMIRTEIGWKKHSF